MVRFPDALLASLAVFNIGFVMGNSTPPVSSWLTVFQLASTVGVAVLLIAKFAFPAWFGKL